MHKNDIKNTIQRFSWVLIRHLVRRQGHAAVQIARIRSAQMYVRGVQTARSVLLFYLGLLALIGLIMAGIVIFHVGLFYCLPWSLKARAVLLMILGGIYFVVPLLVLFFWSRDQFWMKATGADEIVENALKKKTSRKDK